MAEGSARPVRDRRGGNRCRHAGYYSGVGVYVHDSQTLRYLLVCDDCGEEMKEISSLDYVPSPILVTASA